jgi:N-acetylmuramoyl-L-alanine amidase
VGGDGNVYEGRGWHQVGAHTYGFNKKSVGIALIGDFSGEYDASYSVNAMIFLRQRHSMNSFDIVTC